MFQSVFLFVSASFFGDITPHGWQYLMRGHHWGNICMWEVDLCVCVCVCVCIVGTHHPT